MASAVSQFPQEVTDRIGRVLRGKWRLDTLLGVGGMAAVYSATHTNGSRAAIKILHCECSRLPLAAKRFLREGYIANAVGHPGVVRVLDDDVDEDGSVYLVMELLEGASLEAIAQARGGRLSAAEVVHFSDAVLDVLAAAHDRGIVHRDVKPENVFVTKDGKVKLLDFGIAGYAAARGSGPTTQNGAPMGTPAFMPPEQARGQFDLVGPASDLWALGATMFSLLTGEIVHMAASMNEILVASLTLPARSLASVMPDAPASLCNVVDRALEREIANRWTDARAMRAALHRHATTRYRREAACEVTMPVRRARPWRRLPGSPRQWAIALLAAGLSFTCVSALASALSGP